jgi:hypothetical protein
MGVASSNQGQTKVGVTINVGGTNGKPDPDAMLHRLGAGVWPKSKLGAIAGTMDAQSPVIHGFMQTCHTAFAKEIGLEIRPDDIQLCIAQFVARWVGANPAKYRAKLGVRSLDGKEEIKIRHDDLSPADNLSDGTVKWAQVLPAFQQEMIKRLNPTPVMQALQLTFSTTTELDKVVRSVALMDVMQSYFNFVCLTACGIPSIHLHGSADDWRKLHRSLVAYEKELELGWWTKPIYKVLQHFVDAFTDSAKIDGSFWRSLYKYESVSGHSSADGWSILFAPPTLDPSFLRDEKDWQNHQYVRPVSEPRLYGSGLSAVPFVWDCHGSKLPMKFVAGFAAPALTTSMSTISGQRAQATTAWAVLQYNPNTTNKPNTTTKKAPHN